MRCVLLSSLAVLLLYLLFLGAMALLNPVVQRALNHKEKRHGG